ncbi:Imm7 family immunity protein [Longimicrobium sp.]|uniref:Imm7 family immunity protein n=1 Tax=Longimicrobium sp. TaxID=2029185 RepID=UPI002E330AF7|nr:Imm7 family immunity protein [Longimicrobium sp.]HEX6040135.1 Imm7 family immunity protein [Longimicrobium sp.]
MFEYHCWAVVEGLRDADAERALANALEARIAALDDGARGSFHVTNLNTLLVTASGVRNHAQGEVLDVFHWLARQCPGCYGLMYVRPEFPDPDGSWPFQVRQIRRGTVEYLEDRYAVDQP